MNTFYTILFAIVFFAIAIPVGGRLYPNGSGDAYPAWVHRLPNTLLGFFGGIVLVMGMAAVWMSGQVLFSYNSLSGELWTPLIGLTSGILISLHGIGLLAVMLMKKYPDART